MLVAACKAGWLCSSYLQLSHHWNLTLQYLHMFCMIDAHAKLDSGCHTLQAPLNSSALHWIVVQAHKAHVTCYIRFMKHANELSPMSRTPF